MFRSSESKVLWWLIMRLLRHDPSTPMNSKSMFDTCIHSYTHRAFRISVLKIHRPSRTIAAYRDSGACDSCFSTVLFRYNGEIFPRRLSSFLIIYILIPHDLSKGMIHLLQDHMTRSYFWKYQINNLDLRLLPFHYFSSRRQHTSVIHDRPS